MKTLNIDGAEIQYEDCQHCGLAPSEEIVKKEALFYSRMKCSYCGRIFKVTSLTLRHEKDENGDHWRAIRCVREEFIVIEQETPKGFNMKIRLHEACLDKAFPNGWK